MESCRTHIKRTAGPALVDFEKFEATCLSVDSLALVEYAMDLRMRGCTIDLSTSTGGRHRLLQQRGDAYLTSLLQADSLYEIANYVHDVDKICCGKHGCPGGQAPRICSPGCAIAIHQFTKQFQKTLKIIVPSLQQAILKFESRCLAGADSKTFLKAIMNAHCPTKVPKSSASSSIHARANTPSGPHGQE
jgi:hypothetical protein